MNLIPKIEKIVAIPPKKKEGRPKQNNSSFQQSEQKKPDYDSFECQYNRVKSLSRIRIK